MQTFGGSQRSSTRSVFGLLLLDFHPKSLLLAKLGLPPPSYSLLRILIASYEVNSMFERLLVRELTVQ